MKRKFNYLLLLMIGILFIPTILLADENDTNDTEDPVVEETTPVEEHEPRLTSLVVSGYSFTLKFNPNRFDYELVVPSTESKINITAKGDGNSGDIQGTGTKNVLNNNQKFSIVVYSSPTGKKTATYTITVKKQASDLRLKSLIVTGFDLEEEFTAENRNYTLEVDYETTYLDIVARQEDITMDIEISGNEDLVVGTNKIFVKVFNKESLEENIYTITVNRLREEKEVVEEKEEVIVKEDNTFKIVIIVVVIILLLVLSGLGIYFYLKTKKTKPKKNKQKPVKEIKEDLEQTDVITDLSELESLESSDDINSIQTKEIVFDRPDIIDEIDSLFEDDNKDA